MHTEQLGGVNTLTRARRTFSSEFKLEAAKLVVEQNYTIKEAAEAMGVGKSTRVNVKSGVWQH